MTWPVWPTDIPFALRAQDFREEVETGVVEDTMEAGPPKLRRRYGRALRRWTGTLSLTRDQLRRLRAWHDAELRGGVEPCWVTMPPEGVSVLVHVLFAGPANPLPGGARWYQPVELREVAWS